MVTSTGFPGLRYASTVARSVISTESGPLHAVAIIIGNIGNILFLKIILSEFE
jgi:hypothetical protein